MKLFAHMRVSLCLMSVAHLTVPAVTLGAEMDQVILEIRNQGSVVWVEDRLSVRAHLALRDGVVDAVFNGARLGKTNLMEEVRAVFEGEDLEVQRYETKVRGEIIDIRIWSKIVFKDAQTPAKVKWGCFLGGQIIKFPRGSIGPRGGKGLEIQIFSNSGTPVLWFPDLGSTGQFLDVIDQHRESIEWAFEGSEFEFRCLLKDGNDTQTLFHWSPGMKATGRPDSTSLKRMDQFRKMQLSDVYTLFTNLKIAKSGYYAIRPQVGAAERPTVKPGNGSKSP